MTWLKLRSAPTTHFATPLAPIYRRWRTGCFVAMVKDSEIGLICTLLAQVDFTVCRLNKDRGLVVFSKGKVRKGILRINVDAMQAKGAAEAEKKKSAKSKKHSKKEAAEESDSNEEEEEEDEAEGGKEKKKPRRLSSTGNTAGPSTPRGGEAESDGDEDMNTAAGKGKKRDATGKDKEKQEKKDKKKGSDARSSKEGAKPPPAAPVETLPMKFTKVFLNEIKRLAEKPGTDSTPMEESLTLHACTIRPTMNFRVEVRIGELELAPSR